MRKFYTHFFIATLLAGSTIASAQLPPEIMVDKHLIEADQLHLKEDYVGAFNVMEKIIALQKEHNLTLPDEFHFKYARVALSADSIKIAFESVNKYLSATGREGEFYKEALALLIEAEGIPIGAEETCTGKPLGSSCWMALADRPECYVWNPYLQEDDTVTWSGKCSGNVGRGEGTITWEYIEGTQYNPDTEKHEPVKVVAKSTGVLQKGKKHGQWVEHVPGWVSEGSYKGGKAHGHWVLRGPDQRVYEGSYLDDKRHGLWVFNFGHAVDKVSYLDDKRHGQWVRRYWSGAVMNGHYVDGKEHGEFYGKEELCGSWETSLKVIVRGKYVDGKKHGYWQNDTSGFERAGSGRYDEDGLKQGAWTYRDYTCRNRDGRSGSYWNGKSKGDYRDGKKDGTWLRYDQWDSMDWECWSSTYRQGEMVGERKKINMKICRQADW